MKLLTILLLALVGAANAATKCVGPTATGNASGSDWNNLKAWSDSPARGDTWLLVDGTYSGKTLNTGASGTTVITVKKATVADHGGISAGWSDAMGNGQALFTNQLWFLSPYWVFDGMTGGGPGNWDAGFGFKINETGAAAAGIKINNESQPNGPAHDVTFRHVEILGRGSVGDGGPHGNDGVALYGDANNFAMSYGYIHEMGRCPYFTQSSVRDVLFEYVHFGIYFWSAATHAATASMSQGYIGTHTFRYNLFTHILSTGGLMWDNNQRPNPSDLWVYGNVFYHPAGVNWDIANGVIGGWGGGHGEQFHNAHVFNNTFILVNQQSLSSAMQVYSGSEAKNNLWYTCDPPNFSRFPTHDWNHFIASGGTSGEANGTTGSGDPFVNYQGLDFHLTANTQPGTNLGPPYDRDMYGNTRTSWTRGAVEFGKPGPTPTPTPTPQPSPSPTPGPNPTPGLKISDIEGLQEALDAKSDKGHIHGIPTNETTP